jgi:hypothetical protein
MKINITNILAEKLGITEMTTDEELDEIIAALEKADAPIIFED